MTAALPRRGPRPLALHLAIAQASSLGSLAALTSSSPESPVWKSLPQLSGPRQSDRVTRARDALGRHPPEAAWAAVEAEARRRQGELLAGIAAYRRHPYRRDLPDPPVLWQEGATRLLDYGAGHGQPLLVVPSLVNRAYILDLSARTSRLRWLAAQGFRPLLVDWGWPGDTERAFTLTDYIAGRLERALDAALAATGEPVPVIGYCMGGTLAVALAQRRPQAVSRLVLMATPWDFHAGEGAATARALAGALEWAVPWIEWWGTLPVDALQALFTLLDPLLAARKFRNFGRLDQATDKAADFVALEDWLNDGVPLAAPVALECLDGWYGRNAPAKGEWQVAGEAVRPERLTLPSLHLVPARDRIVPPPSAAALADAMPGAERLEPALGHIGMVAAGGAEAAVWRPLAEWLALPRKRRRARLARPHGRA